MESLVLLSLLLLVSMETAEVAGRFRSLYRGVDTYGPGPGDDYAPVAEWSYYTDVDHNENHYLLGRAVDDNSNVTFSGPYIYGFEDAEPVLRPYYIYDYHTEEGGGAQAYLSSPDPPHYDQPYVNGPTGETRPDQRPHNEGSTPGAPHIPGYSERVPDCVDTSERASCKGKAIGNYPTCHRCHEGVYVTCVHHQIHVRPCPDSYYTEGGYSVLKPMVYDPVSKVCQRESSYCRR